MKIQRKTNATGIKDNPLDYDRLKNALLEDKTIISINTRIFEHYSLAKPKIVVGPNGVERLDWLDSETLEVKKLIQELETIKTHREDQILSFYGFERVSEETNNESRDR